MRFELKSPCKDCPFARGSSTNTTLANGRIESIVKDLEHNDKTFQCHKTLEEHVQDQHCAGALLFVKQNETMNNNAMLRLAQRIGIFNADALKDTNTIIAREEVR